MKKTAFILTLGCILVGLSCSKEKTWKNELYDTQWTLDNYDNYLTVHFLGNTSLIWHNKANGGNGNFRGTYSYSKPNISLKLLDGPEPTNLVGTIEGNIMTLSFFGDELVFTKDGGSQQTK